MEKKPLEPPKVNYFSLKKKAIEVDVTNLSNNDDDLNEKNESSIITHSHSLSDSDSTPKVAKNSANTNKRDKNSKFTKNTKSKGKSFQSLLVPRSSHSKTSQYGASNDVIIDPCNKYEENWIYSQEFLDQYEVQLELVKQNERN